MSILVWFAFKLYDLSTVDMPSDMLAAEEKM